MLSVYSAGKREVAHGASFAMQRDAGYQDGTRFAAPYHQATANFLDPFTKARQADADARFYGHSNAVVGNGDMEERTAQMEADRCLGGLRMPMDVRQRLLHHSINRNLDCRGE